MGNTNSNGKKSQSTSPSTNSINSRVEDAFNHMNGGSPVTFGTCRDLFGEDLAESLWDYLSDGAPRNLELNLQQFSKHANSLTGMSTDVYVKLCFPVHHFIKVCSEAAGVVAVDGDQHFINALAAEMCPGGSSVQDVVSWKQSTCPNFCHAVQNSVQSVFLGCEKTAVDYSSDILTPLQMWFLQSALPPVYFTAKLDKEAGIIHHWTPLYTSAMQGISVNRFEKNVFDYRGATVTLFQLSDKRVVALATEQEWRHGSTRFGGPATVFFELFPGIKRIDAPSSIYCNFKIRSAAFGLSFKDIMNVDKEMSNVVSVEVWGCASANTLADQQKLKQWQGQQAEKHKKVPLPGNWDDNPDKTLLEMAGFQFSNERQMMELEAKANARNPPK